MIKGLYFIKKKYRYVRSFTVHRPISQARAFQIALGNIDVNTGDPLYDFNPDTFKVWLNSLWPSDVMWCHEP